MEAALLTAPVESGQAVAINGDSAEAAPAETAAAALGEADDRLRNGAMASAEPEPSVCEVGLAQLPPAGDAGDAPGTSAKVDQGDAISENPLMGGAADAGADAAADAPGTSGKVDQADGVGEKRKHRHRDRERDDEGGRGKDKAKKERRGDKEPAREGRCRQRLCMLGYSAFAPVL